jgi:hypothetical protein
MSFNPNDHMMLISRFDKRLGKQVQTKYLEVKWRLVWFRELYPQYRVITSVHSVTDESALISASILDENGVTRVTGHGHCTSEKWDRYVEKAETAAIGRALAVLGIGTQFAIELDEDPDEFADAPVETKKEKSQETRKPNFQPREDQKGALQAINPHPSPPPKPSGKIRNLQSIYSAYQAKGYPIDTWRALLKKLGITPDIVSHRIVRLDNLEAEIEKMGMGTEDRQEL